MKCETGMFYTFWTAAEKQTSPFQRSESELASNPDRQIKSEFPHSVVKSSRQRPLITVLHDFCRIVSINQLLPDHRPWHLLHRILCKKYCSVCVCVWDRKCPSRCTVFKAKWWSVFFHKKKKKTRDASDLPDRSLPNTETKPSDMQSPWTLQPASRTSSLAYFAESKCTTLWSEKQTRHLKLSETAQQDS